MRTMWMFGAVMVVGCGSQERTLVGQVPSEVTGVHAIDAAGARTDGAVTEGTFLLELGSGAQIVYVDVGDAPYVVKFASVAGGLPDRTTIPDFRGEVDLGAVTLHESGLRSTTADEDWAEPEENPLEQVDSDDDGEDDDEDEDDDDDGEGDEEDDDDDGDGEDDDGEDEDEDEDEDETETETD